MIAEQRLTAQLQQYAPVNGRALRHEAPNNKPRVAFRLD
jgi:hypothetical protein